MTEQDKKLQEQETRIYLALKEAIIKGAFPPGYRLVERELAEQFSLSRTPVRWAIKRLEAEGFLEQNPNRGAYVKMLNSKDIIDLLYVRESLEGMASRLAAKNRTKEEEERFMEIVNNMISVSQKNDFLSYYSLSSEFHQLILAAARNEPLGHLVERIGAQVTRFQFKNLLMAGRISQSVIEHKEIAEAICSGNEEKAEEAIRQHIKVVRELIEKEAAKPEFITF